MGPTREAKSSGKWLRKAAEESGYGKGRLRPPPALRRVSRKDLG